MDAEGRELVRAALAALGVENFVLLIQDFSFPEGPGGEVGVGSPYGEGARRFLRFAHALGFDGLQLGPQGLTTEGNPSPYDGAIFARNEVSLALDELAGERWGGLLPASALEAAHRGVPEGGPPRRRYEYAFRAQTRLLDEAHAALRARVERRGVGSASEPVRAAHEALGAFREAEAEWLAPAAVYEALCREHGQVDWRRWPAGPGLPPDRRLYAPRPGEAGASAKRLRELEARRGVELERFAFGQLVAREQHARLRLELGDRGIKLFGDLQVGYSIRDVWAYGSLFLRDYAMGAPPSRTNPEGQPWNYPVLDPALYFERDGAPGPVVRFARRRMLAMLRDYDGVRLDHPHGLVCPWVYRADAPDALAAVQGGARLFESPDEADHPELAASAIARPEQIDRSVARYADGRVRGLDEAQVARYAALFDVVLEAAAARGRSKGDVLCEVLSTQPYPLGRVRDRHGLGRFRITQKANVDDERDVYRSENAAPEDWVMAGNHDTKPLWLLADEWRAAGRLGARAAYVASRLRPEGPGRRALAAAIEADPGRLVEAMAADLFACPAKNVVVFFPDLFGLREVYNAPGEINDANWLLRVPADYERSYPARVAAGRALDLPAALADALRARGPAFAARHEGLAAKLDARRARPALLPALDPRRARPAAALALDPRRVRLAVLLARGGLARRQAGPALRGRPMLGPIVDGDVDGHGRGVGRVRRGLEQAFEPDQRHVEPGGPIVELVADLVDALLEQVKAEHAVAGRVALGHDGRAAHDLEVGADEGGRGPVGPGFGPGAQVGGVFGAQATVAQGRGGGVLKRSHHAGHVAQGAALVAPLDQVPRRLALEVDDDEVVAGREHLAEVVVAVNAHAPALEPGLHELAQPGVDLGLAGEQRLGPLGRLALEGAELAAQRLEGAHQQRVRRLEDRLLVHRRERLGRERRVFRVRRERYVHLGGAPAEQPRGRGVRAQERREGLGRLGGRLIEQGAGRPYGADGRVARGGEHAFVVAVELVERDLPGAAAVRHEALHDGDGGCVAPLAAVLEGSNHGRRVREVGLLGEEAADLLLGVRPLFGHAVKFEQHAIAVHDGRVALFDLGHPRHQLFFARAELFEAAVGCRDQLPALALAGDAPPQVFEQ
jgi:4-alpha-glucanotransferase